MPFQSEKQRRYLWANEPEIARDWTDTYGSGIAKALGGRIPYRQGMDDILTRRSHGCLAGQRRKRNQSRGLLMREEDNNIELREADQCTHAAHHWRPVINQTKSHC